MGWNDSDGRRMVVMPTAAATSIPVVPGPALTRPRSDPGLGQGSARLCASVFASARPAQGAPAVGTQTAPVRRGGISAQTRQSLGGAPTPGGRLCACVRVARPHTGPGAEAATRVPLSHKQAQPAEEPAGAEGGTPHPGVTGLQLAPWPRARGAGGWPRAARDISGPPLPASCQASPSRCSWVWAGSHRWPESLRDEGGGAWRRRCPVHVGKPRPKEGRGTAKAALRRPTRLPVQANLWGTRAGTRGPADLGMNVL